jgi:prefoldin subunit 5
MHIVFHKTGKEVKKAIQQRCQQLQARLDKRNQALDEFLKNPQKVRSYIIRSQGRYHYHHSEVAGQVLFSQDEVFSEEREEIDQLCKRIFEIEQELYRLQLIVTHLEDDRKLELSFDDLVDYGFDTNIE